MHAWDKESEVTIVVTVEIMQEALVETVEQIVVSSASKCRLECSKPLPQSCNISKA